MGHVIRKQVTRPDYGQVPGELFPYEHEFAEPVHWQYVIIDDPEAPPYRTPEAPAPEAGVQPRVQQHVQAGTARAAGQVKG